MRKIIILLQFLLLGIVGISYGRVEFTLVDDIKLSGENFGNGGIYDYVCFNNDETCYNYNNPGIKQWNKKEIIVTPLLDIPSRGKIIVYHDGNSSEFSYALKPLIGGVFNESGNFITSVCRGDTLYVSGLGLSNSDAYVWNKNGYGTREISIEDIEIASRDFVEQMGYPNLYGVIEYAKIETKGINFDIESIYLENNGLSSDSYKISILDNITNDPYSCMQSYLHQIEYDKYSNLFKNKGKGITVAIIDDGLNHNHPDLKEALHVNKEEIPNNGLDDDNNGYTDDVHGWNFSLDSYIMDDFGGHGTLIGGIIAAKSNNGIGIGGIADETKLMTLIINLDDNNSKEQINQAIVYATNNGANIINLSFGNVFNSRYDESLDEAIKYAFDNNVIIVAAAGNGDYTKTQDRDLDVYPSSPVCNDGGNNMISGVTSIDANKNKSLFGDYGDECVDYALPGENIISTSHPSFSSSSSEYDRVDGTSFSAPILAGIYSLVWSNYPELSSQGVRDIVEDMSYSNEYTNSEKIGKYINLGAFTEIDSSTYEKRQKSAIIEDSKIPDITLITNKIQNDELKKEITDIELVNWLLKNGLTKYEYSNFNPEGLITREQSAKFLSNFGKLIGLENKRDNTCVFMDLSSADYSLVPFVYETCGVGLLKGSNGYFYPFRNISYIESLTVAIRSIYGPQNESLDPRYIQYYNMGIERNIYELASNDVDKPISRITFGRILYNTYLNHINKL